MILNRREEYSFWIAAMERQKPQVVDRAVIVIGHKFLTLNEALAMNRHKRNSAKRKDTAQVWRAWWDQGQPSIVGKYHVAMHHVRSNKRFDPSNISTWAEKVILDALSKRHCGCKCIEDDSWRYHVSTEHTFEFNPDMNAVTVKITSAEKPF